MKTCSKCNVQKTEEDFAFKNRGKGTRSSICRNCHKQYRDQHYAQNRDSYLARRKRQQKEGREWLCKYKATLSCSKCGVAHPAVIEFHHPDEDKLGDVSTLAAYVSRQTLMAEIEKCVPLCCNCHRILHYEERVSR